MQENLQLKNLPSELKMNALWCGWKLTDKGKEPFNLQTGYHAKSNDETTFSSYPVLLNNLHKYLKYDGDKQIGGIGLGIFRGYSAIDIDHCVENGAISDMARDIIDYCNSYTEYSPSGTGIRIIFKTQTKIDKDLYYINNHNNGLEIYISDNTNKFVSITGNKISGDMINEVDITYILDKYMKKGVFNIQKVLKKDEKLNTLWNKQAPGSHSDESESDMALLCKLAYYLKNDAEQIRSYFESSPYFLSKDQEHIKKWNRGYGDDAIKKATMLVNVVPQTVTVKKYDYNDTGNAHRFIEMFGNDLRYNYDNKMWMVWNDMFWQYDISESVKNLIEILAEKMLYESTGIMDMNERGRALKNIEHIYSSAGKESLLKEARHIAGVPVSNSQFDTNPFYICTDSGYIDLQTGDLLPFKREEMMSMSTGCTVSFEPPKRFLKFLSEMFEGDKEIIHYVHKALGYSITSSTREQCLFILSGDGNSGKSLLLDTVKRALGSYAITSQPQLITDNKFKNANLEEVARLNGKRFCAIQELKQGDKLDEQLVKELTSGLDTVTARFLYSNSFEFYMRCKIWLATNYDAVITGTDRGIWRRIRKIPVNSDFTGREDKDLGDKLQKELPEILGWLIQGALLYHKEGLNEPEVIKQATSDYRKEMDIVQQWIDEYCEMKPSYFERANILYDNFRLFCQRRDLRTNQTAFGRNLGKKFKKYNSGSGIVYIGIRLKKEATDIAKRVAFEQLIISDEI